MSQHEVSQLYKHNKIKCLVSATRGEGYGLPLIEAAASGLPVIATGWSGHTDFLEEGKYVMLDYYLEEINKSRIDNRIFVDGTRWANVSESDFKRKTRNMFENYNNHKKNSSSLQKSVHKKFSKDVIIEKYDEFFKKIVKG